MPTRLALIPGYIVFASAVFAQLPHPTSEGFNLANGWKISPVGKAVWTEDLVLKLVTAPDGKAVIASHSGYNPHGVVVIDAKTQEVTQRIGLKTTWMGMAWSRDGKTLYVSGGNANSSKEKGGPAQRAPIYMFSYANGKLSDQPMGQLDETIPMDRIYWSGIAIHPKKNVVYAANRGTLDAPSNVVAFDEKTGQIVARIPAEVNPYELAFTPDGDTLFVSNWASRSVTVIDTRTNRVTGTIAVGSNPNDMKISPDGRLFVACSNDNTIYVIDGKKRTVIERLSTTLSPQAPEGSTPDALELDAARKLLFVANADNNSIGVINIADPKHSEVLGFIPSGWYPSALTLVNGGQMLYVGNSKGQASYPDIKGPGSPLASKWDGDESIKTMQKGSVEMIPLSDLRQKLSGYTKQVMANTPYEDSQLTLARAPKAPTVIPREVGAGSPIEHIIYIIKENRTYDQVFGDIAKGNGDSRLTIFGKNVTPNQHALAEQYVLLDNLYCDGEVSVDGHSWSNSAYATDFNEKLWPQDYGGHGKAEETAAYVPSAGHLWDLARRKGLTYRSYGEYARRASDGKTMQAAKGVDGLWGHVSPQFRLGNMRDTENVDVFLKELAEYEQHFDDTNPAQRLPNFMVMSLGEDHTRGTQPGAFTPVAMVANNDQAIGRLVDRVSHSKYWDKTAIFIIEDDAQDGPDHVDARRTVGLVISPYVKRGIVDSTLYTTSSFVRSMELLLGLPPMSQYDAAAMPLYASFDLTANPAAFDVLPPQVDLNAKNTAKSFGSRASAKMDFDEYDEAPMKELNEIIWRSVRGADSPMPAPVHRYRPLAEAR
ncbi:MAG TPA: alkaline phosphatase family protein [Bryobacteraceae bacterium]|nr:alkaline phosphatase family protein [Bryobacteraceae bacterium]